MTNFEAITKNPETLAAFLRDLPILEGPWDEEFQRNYCAGCGKVSCDDGSPCPYEDKREGPWDEEFQRNYCAGCGKVSCDDGSPCPYEDKRNSPGWWLGLEAVAAEAV